MNYRARAGYLIVGDQGSYRVKTNEIKTKKISGKILTGYCLSRNLENSNFLIHGRIFNKENFFQRIIKSRLEPGKLAAELRTVEGNYSFVLPNSEKIVFARDPLGLKPLFYGRRNNLIGLASDANSLVRIGLEVTRVTPGYVYTADFNSIERSSIYQINGFVNNNITFNEASEELLKLITNSLLQRINRKKIMIGFSGGIDSSLIALLSSRISKMKLVSIYMKGSRDEKNVRSSAKLLGFDLIEKNITNEFVEKSLDNISILTGKLNPMDMALSLAVNIAALTAYEEGCDELILGQLADELFGGYARYQKAFAEKGSSYTHSMMINDVRAAYRNNFERDEVSSSPYSELILPYASNEIVNYSLSIPPHFKINSIKDERKIILRQIAKNAGLPVDILNQSKKALQYSTGLLKSISRILKTQRKTL
jgi:asparagine synthase (glutamine-hydrolysing)